MIEVRSSGRGDAICKVEGKGTLKELIADGVQCVAAIIGIIAQTDGKEAAELYVSATIAVLQNEELMKTIIKEAIEQAQRENN